MESDEKDEPEEHEGHEDEEDEEEEATDSQKVSSRISFLFNSSVEQNHHQRLLHVQRWCMSLLCCHCNCIDIKKDSNSLIKTKNNSSSQGDSLLLMGSGSLFS
jgi:hypothetical protein